ncbi:DUF4327 family protein [Kamptonema formosum]|uniref:DUF4327 family protein n=1 Tax=Kamptonema formosum TaxID=331992 RepID=UPI000345A3DE|nr:DUF4327 family protein [Oscillatoria sp. PCC 10802]
MVHSTVRYSVELLKEEARSLIQKGSLSRQQPIYTLCKYIPAREWICVESALAQCDFLLRDRIGDLINGETWEND